MFEVAGGEVGGGHGEMHEGMITREAGRGKVGPVNGFSCRSLKALKLGDRAYRLKMPVLVFNYDSPPVCLVLY